MNLLIAGWWIFLLCTFVFTWRLIGYKNRITTFTLFLPLLFLVFGFFSPFSYRGISQDFLNRIGAENRLPKKEVHKRYEWMKLKHSHRFFLSLALAFLFLPVGVWLANYFIRQPNFSGEQQLVNITGDWRKTKIYLWVIFAISALSIFQIYKQGLLFPIWDYISGSMAYQDYELHRYSFAAAAEHWTYLLYHKLPYAIAPLGIILVVNLKDIATWIKAGFLTVLVFALIQSGHKMPLIYLVGLCLFSKFAIQNNLALSKKIIWVCAILFGATFFIFLPVFYWMQGTLGYLHALYWSFRRIFIELGHYLPLYFEVFPDIHGFLLGKSSRLFSLLTGQMSEHVWPIVYIPQTLLGMKNTSFPTLFIGEAWADFGYLGVIISSVLVGFILQAYNLWYYGKIRPSLDETALFLAVVVGSLHLLESNFLTALLSYGLMTNALIFVLIRGEKQADETTG